MPLMTLEISCDRAKLTESTVKLVMRKSKAIRVCDQFMKLWCGDFEPTKELLAELATFGLEIVPGCDHLGGWDVRKIQDPAGQLNLID